MYDRRAKEMKIKMKKKEEEGDFVHKKRRKILMK